MKPITADSTEGRILLALRAGAIEAEVMNERFPGFSAYIKPLTGAGLIVKAGDAWSLTPAGRAACPFRNKLADPSAARQEENTMGRGPITQRAVIDAIVAAGPEGINCEKLAEQLGCTARAVSAHTSRAILNGGGDAEIVSWGKRHYVGACFLGRGGRVDTKPATEAPSTATAEAHARVDEAEVEKIAVEYAEMIDFDLEAAQGLDLTADGVDKAWPISPAPTPLEEGFVDALRESAGRNGVTPTSYSSNLPSHLVLAEDIELDDPEQVEFAIFSSGGLDMYTDQGNVTLSRDVLRKLRAFLGLFAEEVA